MLKHRAARLNDERGSLVVEMGLIVMPMVSLIMILFIVGMALNLQVSLTNAAREGVRVLALEGSSAAWQTRAAEASSLTGVSVTGGWASSVPPAQPCAPSTHAGQGYDVFVKVTRPFNWTLPAFLGGGELGWGSANPMAGRAEMRCGG